MKISTLSNSLSRSEASLRFDKLYKRVPTAGVCFYCGNDAQTGDHVPPLSSARKRDVESAFWLVPSCQRCNSLLGTHQSVDLAVRCKYLHQKYESAGEPIEIPEKPGDIYVWVIPPLHDEDRDLIGRVVEAISGGALVYAGGRLGGDLRRSVLQFAFHRNERIARGILSGMLGRALHDEKFLWGFGVIPSMLLPDPRPTSQGTA